MLDEREVTVVARLSNGHAEEKGPFYHAMVSLKGPFVVVYHKKENRELEDWFSVGSVLRVKFEPQTERR